MNSNRIRCITLALGAAAAVFGAGTAHAVPDFQVSVDGIDLFPTAGNAATAVSTFGNMAIASGVGANANASDGFGNIADATGTDADALTLTTSTSVFDSSWASGTNTLAEAGNGIVDTAVATGTGSEAIAGGGSFDTAIASQGALAEATGSSGLFAVEPAAAAAALPAAGADPADLDGFQDLHGVSALTSAVDSFFVSLLGPTLAGGADAQVDLYNSVDADPLSDLVGAIDPNAFPGGVPNPNDLLGLITPTLDYGIITYDLPVYLQGTGLDPLIDPLVSAFQDFMTALDSTVDSLLGTL